MTLRPRLKYLGHHFRDPGAQGGTKDTLRGPDSISIDFKLDLETLLGPTLGMTLRLSMIWDSKIGHSFQVHVFCDPGWKQCQNAMAAYTTTAVRTMCFE